MFAFWLGAFSSVVRLVSCPGMVGLGSSFSLLSTCILWVRVTSFLLLLPCTLSSYSAVFYFSFLRVVVAFVLGFSVMSVCFCRRVAHPFAFGVFRGLLSRVPPFSYLSGCFRFIFGISLFHGRSVITVRTFSRL